MCFQFRSPEAHRCPLTHVYHIANFKVKNDGHVNLYINYGIHPQLHQVVVGPGETSPPFDGAGTYYIRPENQEPSEIVVTFSPKKEIEAKSIGNPIDTEIIAKFD